MYDTITIWLETNQSAACAQRLEKAKDIVDQNTGLVQTNGYIGNLRVKLNPNGILVEGSLPKFLHGSNFESFSKNETKEAINKLSDSLQLNFKPGVIKRIDVAANIKMDNPVNLYFDNLGKSKHYKRSIYGKNETLYYNNYKKKMAFYDKGKEMKRKKNYPENLSRDNYLRYEFRLLCRITDQLHLPIVTVEMLYNEVFYSALINMWVNEYEAIQKIKRINPGEIRLKDRRSFQKLWARVGIDAYGVDNSRRLIVYKKKELTNNQYYALIKAHDEILTSPAINVSDELIIELDQKVRQAAIEAR